MSLTDFRHLSADAVADAPPTAVGDEPAKAGPPADENTLTIVPVRQFVLFPGVVMPVALKDPTAIAAAQHAVRQGLPIGLVMQRGGSDDEPYAPINLHRMGVVANVLRYVTGPDGEHHLVCQGEQRFHIDSYIQERPFLQARVQRHPDPSEAGPADLEARFIHLQGQALEALGLLPQATPELMTAVRSINTPAALADFIAAYSDMPPDGKQDVLETLDLPRRIQMVSSYLAERIEVLRLSQEIGRQTRASLDERQREVLLREQLATIQRQLGEDEGAGKAQEIAELTAAIDEAGMPEEVEKAARKELRRLERMPEAAAEYGMIRTYLDWLIELPWKLPDDPPVDIAKAREVLEADHHGLERIKERILEFLAVRKLAPEGKAPILCFAGPPGVGKTSLGQSIARAMQRPFVRVSLGGVHDEAEIRGHRRTYIGALPGNIIQGIRKAGSRQCVMMLDEIDKMGRGVQGDPSAAMLEVLDPEQNGTFRDNYLGVPFDLSRVVFIATANMLEGIPGPLRDRMEVITLSGYTDDEKLEIARRYLIPKALEANGLAQTGAGFDDAAIRDVIRQYTREAGVRNLERELGRALRKVAVRVAEGQNAAATISAGQIHELLGTPRFDDEVAMRTSLPGVATGLAWTPVGGDILFIEAALTPGKGKLTLTGQLGDVMRESVQAALSLVKSRSQALGISPEKFDTFDLHVHVPAGATPKDGPSAGVAMTTALVSILTGRPVRPDTAMTGEISLRGLVLPVGGIKEKVVAAARSGISRVMLPARNRRDYDDIPADVRERLEFIWLDNVDQALAEALVPADGGGNVS
ncbi:MAG: endopeptidase La [Pigmentiphaga sp.]|nr:endopeptidase La [Pigmentiphaga sp.]